VRFAAGIGPDLGGAALRRSPAEGDGARRRLVQACSMRPRTASAAALAFGLGLAISLAWSLVFGHGL
jgi:hypothetical protein